MVVSRSAARRSSPFHVARLRESLPQAQVQIAGRATAISLDLAAGDPPAIVPANAGYAIDTDFRNGNHAGSTFPSGLA
jgi:hypothetical protein